MKKKSFTYKVAIQAILLVLEIIIMILNYMGIYLGPSNRGIDKIREDSEIDSRHWDANPQYMNITNCGTNLITNSTKYNMPIIGSTKDPPKDQIIEYHTINTRTGKIETEGRIKKRIHQKKPEVANINKQIKKDEGITLKVYNTPANGKEEIRIILTETKKATTSESKRKIYQTNDIEQTDKKINTTQKSMESYFQLMEKQIEWHSRKGAVKRKIPKISNFQRLFICGHPNKNNLLQNKTQKATSKKVNK